MGCLKLKIENDRAILQPYDYDQKNDPNSEKPGIKVHNFAMGFFLSLFGAAKRVYGDQYKIVYLDTKDLNRWLKNNRISTPQNLTETWVENTLRCFIELRIVTQMLANNNEYEGTGIRSTSHKWWESASYNAQLGNREQALEDITKAIKLDPYNRSYLEMRAKLYIAADCPFIAIVDYKTILNHNPEDFDAQFKLAKLSMEIAKFEQAIEICDKLLKSYPPEGMLGSIYRIRGNANYKLGQEDKALKDYTKSVKADQIHFPSRGLFKNSGQRFSHKIHKALNNQRNNNVPMEGKELISAAEKKGDVLSITPADVKEHLNSSSPVGGLSLLAVFFKALANLSFPKLFGFDIKTTEGFVRVDYAEVEKLFKKLDYKVKRLDDELFHELIIEALEMVKLDKMIEKKPHKAKFYFWRAHYYQGKCKFEKALADINRALDCEPNNLRYLEERIDILRELKTPEALRAALEDCDQINGLMPTYKFVLGETPFDIREGLEALFSEPTIEG